MAGGRGCGARELASQACLREAPGSRPPLLRGAALTGWTRRGRRRAKACRIGGPARAPSASGSYGPGDRKAAMERREAPAFLARGARQDGRLVRHSVLHPLALREGEKLGPAQAGRTTAYPAPQRIRAAKLGCLKIESGRESSLRLILRSARRARLEGRGGPGLMVRDAACGRSSP